MTVITKLSANAHDLPLEHPFEISLGAREQARNVLVTVETESGVRGYGEGSPMPPVTGETQQSALATARAAANIVEGRDSRNYRALVRDIRRSFPGMVSALFAVETAILDAYCRHRGIPLAELFGGRPKPVQTDVTIPILPPETAAQRAEEAASAGFDHLKIKTGNTVEADLERVAAVHEAAPDAALKVDANQGWTPVEAERFVDRVTSRGIGLALLEQPVSKDDIVGLSRVREGVSVPVAADEAVFSPADAMRVVREDAADIINVKLGKSGLLNAAAIAEIAEAANLELMVGCMLESAVGIHASAHLVSGVGSFDYIDLDGNLLLAEDVVETEFSPQVIPSGPGHGISISD
ncbi:Muconate cycloisomerase [Haloferax elongans ATCC BAA-1513]|uniref:Muconate cycloisomerase n=1 Tax=Haloferax elongans ATCC BAA-1513 TaxID=1230453 RepID=M0HHI3_HALEO|nr:dipeptide epimerase [Haloferax elongans]ELZ83197.1 Muconate cycloisomerase [Haloferax elongans ATCC BAA-1513]